MLLHQVEAAMSTFFPGLGVSHASTRPGFAHHMRTTSASNQGHNLFVLFMKPHVLSHILASVFSVGGHVSLEVYIFGYIGEKVLPVW